MTQFLICYHEVEASTTQNNEETGYRVFHIRDKKDIYKMGRTIINSPKVESPAEVHYHPPMPMIEF